MKVKKQSPLLRNQYDIKWLRCVTGADVLTEISRIIESFKLPVDHIELPMYLIISVVMLMSRIYFLKIHLILVVYKFPWYLVSIS